MLLSFVYISRTCLQNSCALFLQCAVVSILSRVNFDLCGDIMEEMVVPLLGKLVSEPTGRLFNAVIFSQLFSHLKCNCNACVTKASILMCRPRRIKVIVDDNAFQAVCKAFCEPNLDIYCLSKFLVAVCRGYRIFSGGFPSDKVLIIRKSVYIYIYGCISKCIFFSSRAT